MANFLDDWVAKGEQTSYAKIKKAYDAALAKASNQALPAPQRLKAANDAEGWKRQLDSHPVSTRKVNTDYYSGLAESQLQAKGFVPAAKPQGQQVQTLFDAPTGTTTPPTSANAAAPVNPSDPATLFSQVLGGPVTITSGYRDPAHNAKVGGVKGSDHTKLQANGQPMAWDVKPPKGVTPQAAAAALAAQGFGTIAEPDRGVVHVSVNPKQVARGALEQTGGPGSGFVQIAPTVAKGDPLDVGAAFAVSPQAAMGMVPSPRMMPRVDLPNAPQQELPDPRPQYSMMDKQAMLAPIAEAIQPKPIDTSHNAWDRVAALLQGAAQSAAGVSPWAGTGQFLLAAGGGAAGGFRSERKEQEAKQDQYDESVRQAKLVLAKMGYEIDTNNFTTGNANLDRAWQSSQDVKQVKFQNETAADGRNVAEILQNAGITQQNIGALNQRDMQRAQVGIGALGNVAEAQNTVNARQSAVNVRAAENAGSQQGSDQELIALGIDPKVKSPLVDNARGTLAAANAKNVGLAFSGLARELVLSGHYKDTLGDADAKAVERAIQNKDVEGAAQVVAGALTANMSKQPEAVLALVDELAALGLPSAVIISKKRQRANPTAK